MVGIANTLDLPEQLMARISSRMGHCRLVFTPYNSDEIKTIIKQRLETVKNVFDKNAITYISKKVASVSSDIRKTLHICRETVQAFKKKIEKEKEEGRLDRTIEQKIDISLVAEVFKATYQSPLLDFVNSSTETVKLVLTCMCLEFRKNDFKVCQYKEVYSRFTTLSQTFDIPRYKFSEIKLIITQLTRIGIVEITSNKKCMGEEISLIGNFDELCYTLKDFEPFTRCYAMNKRDMI